ncbi:MAG TPA: DUF6176 family protein [Candidatus Dormibacteraeota bacterium]|nr:DUF6176 family protein [Candidatus Dormibacteraeota bacterium]
MPRSVIAFPVVPGKDASSVAAVLTARKNEYVESRERAGITMERAFEQPTPMGTFVVVYMEAERSIADSMAAVAASGLPIDRDFIAAVREVHGVDMTQPPPGRPPEIVGEWVDPDVRDRRRGLAFCAPLIPGRTDAGRAFAQEAFVSRRSELAESRRALGQNVEVVALNSTPAGDIICVYLEGHDPVEGNRGFAASQRSYDVWFKQQLATIFPPQIDFSQPVPPITQIWDWQRSTVRT